MLQTTSFQATQKAMQYSFSACSHSGQVRHNNQDSYLANPQMGLWIVADGMGGHEHGELASKMACSLIEEQVVKGEAVDKAIEHAHMVIKEYSWHHGLQKGMGTTVVVLHMNTKENAIYWVGDSRAYLFSDHKLTKLSHDHSLVQELLDRKIITPLQAQEHPKRNMITQSLGMMTKATIKVDKKTFSSGRNCCVLLCSDGLTNELNSAEIKSILQTNATLGEQSTQLIDQANLKGGRDNITAMLIQTE